MSGTRRRLTVLGLVAAAVLVSACDENEQDRVLYHEKGVYQGRADTPISPETADELRARARRQAG